MIALACAAALVGAVALAFWVKGLVQPRPQPVRGDGWVMLAWEQGQGPDSEVGIATDSVSYERLWDATRLAGSPSEVDFPRGRVVLRRIRIGLPEDRAHGQHVVPELDGEHGAYTPVVRGRALACLARSGSSRWTMSRIISNA